MHLEKGGFYIRNDIKYGKWEVLSRNQSGSEFSLMKKLVHILGGHGIGINIHGCQSNPRNDHLCITGQKIKL